MKRKKILPKYNSGKTYEAKDILPEVTVTPDGKIDPFALPTLELFVLSNLKKYQPGLKLFYPRNINPLYNSLMKHYDDGKSTKPSEWTTSGKDEYGYYDLEYPGGKYLPGIPVDEVYSLLGLKPDLNFINLEIEDDIVWKVYRGGKLPELVVDPIFPLSVNKEIDKYVNTDTKLNRFMETYNAAGRPDVYELEGENIHDYMDDNKTPRAYMHPKGVGGLKNDELYVKTYDDLLAELAHPLQRMYGNVDNALERSRGNYNGDVDVRGGSRYMYPDRYEGETHSDFEPLITKYIHNNLLGTTPSYRLEFPTVDGSEYATLLGHDKQRVFNTIPKDIFEVLDSAKSYNMLKQLKQLRNYVPTKYKNMPLRYNTSYDNNKK